MQWNVNEPQCLSTARLMVASPEFVYEQLKYYGENAESFLGSKEELETVLLTRDNKLVNLALAQFGFNGKVVKTLYDRATSGTDDKDGFSVALRVACLSNRNLGWSGWPDFGLEALFAKGFTPECHALLTNPTIPTSIFVSLYRKAEYFAQVDESIWLGMVNISMSNERLVTDNESIDGPDLDLWNINKAIFNFLEVAPVSDQSIRTAKYLLETLGATQGVWPEDISPVLKKWGEVEARDYKGDPERGEFTRLTLTQELRCLIAALYCNRGPLTKDGLRHFGSRNDTDVALRCAYYAGYSPERNKIADYFRNRRSLTARHFGNWLGLYLSKKEFEAAWTKDEEIFVYAVFKNQLVLLDRVFRPMLEKRIYGRDLWKEYIRRCRQIQKTWKSFDPRPVSESARAMVRALAEDEATHPQTKEEIWLEKISGQNEKLEKINAQNKTMLERIRIYEKGIILIVVLLAMASTIVKGWL